MITKQEYAARRQKLAKQLPDNSIALIWAANEMRRNGDTHYRFRQASHFYYLTGYQEPDALLAITDEGISYLFNRPRNPAQEQWTGIRLGQEAAVDALGVQQAFSIEVIDSKLPELLTNKSAVYCLLTEEPRHDNHLLQLLSHLKNKPRTKLPDVCALEPLLSEMRVIKSEAEIALISRAADISAAAHKRAMQACSKLTHEYQLEAELMYEFSRQGCRAPAYEPIVAGGANACILHYSANNQPLHAGDLVLIDAAGEYENYAADITRTFPVNGTFTTEQRALYQLVLKAQKAGMACIKPGECWTKVQQIIVRVMTAGLCDLGILQGELESLLATEAYKPFYMHSSSHWLGLDVHDAGSYKIADQWRQFVPGMVLTVEPGLYIQANTPGVDKKWFNIGIRIEDDVLVTKDGFKNLTAALPVEIEDIEALMRG